MGHITKGVPHKKRIEAKRLKAISDGNRPRFTRDVMERYNHIVGILRDNPPL